MPARSNPMEGIWSRRAQIQALSPRRECSTSFVSAVAASAPGCVDCNLHGFTHPRSFVDVHGTELTEQRDEFCYGWPEGCRSSTYDANGNMLTFTSDTSYYGEPECCYWYPY